MDISAKAPTSPIQEQVISLPHHCPTTVAAIAFGDRYASITKPCP
ncbi:MAG: hypothetical protein V7L25_24245 [Nostoc sp.]